MKTFVHHIASFALVALVVFSGVTVAYADKSKKTVDKNSARKTADQVVKAVSPAVGAVDVVVSAMNRKQAIKNTGSNAKIKVSSDTVKRDSRILFALVASDVFKTRIDVVSDQQQIDIGIYNMLGKRMADVYSGPASKGEHDYTLPASDLPEGVYICILQGSNFRRAEKFYLNR